MINGSIRNTDRTNLYGTSSKYQGKPIWSTGAAWRIDQEKFFTARWGKHPQAPYVLRYRR